MSVAPSFSITAVDLFERPVRLRLPFRFGAVTVREAPQAFVRVRIRLDDGHETVGAAAELMVPKWFDKNPERSQSEDIEALRQSLQRAATAYGDGEPRTAFGHFAAHYAELGRAAREDGIADLVAAFGAAEIDKAIVDALGRAVDRSFFELLSRNVVGFAPARLAPDLACFDADAFLAGTVRPPSIVVRHTVGMLDALVPAGDGAGDGLPTSLEEAIATYGLTHFKLKLSGRPAADLERLGAIAAVLDRACADYRVTLDGNEQFQDAEAVADLGAALARTPALATFRARILFLEQPLPRATALARRLDDDARFVPLVIDESDGDLDAFLRARALGYSGVSTKSCKGLWKSLTNAARCLRWNAPGDAPRYFMSAEDLTTQAGLAVQQDLALASALGIEHVERNGHHYVDGFAGQAAPESEQAAFLAAHPDLYHATARGVRLCIEEGRVSLRSLAGPGFASGARPDWRSLAPLAGASTLPARTSP